MPTLHAEQRRPTWDTIIWKLSEHLYVLPIISLYHELVWNERIFKYIVLALLFVILRWIQTNVIFWVASRVLPVA